MKRVLLGLVVFSIMGLFTPTVDAQAGEDDGSKITITAPADGATVDGASLELKYELAKGAKAHHAHVFLDGKYQKGFKGTFTNLPAGKHEIKVVAATDEHKTLAAESAVTITVK